MERDGFPHEAQPTDPAGGAESRVTGWRRGDFCSRSVTRGGARFETQRFVAPGAGSPPRIIRDGSRDSRHPAASAGVRHDPPPEAKSAPGRTPPDELRLTRQGFALTKYMVTYMFRPAVDAGMPETAGVVAGFRRGAEPCQTDHSGTHYNLRPDVR